MTTVRVGKHGFTDDRAGPKYPRRVGAQKLTVAVLREPRGGNRLSLVFFDTGRYVGGSRVLVEPVSYILDYSWCR